MEARTGNQIRTFERLLTTLRPHLREDRNLPARIQKLLTGERRFGSRDRRLYRELLYTTIRFLPWFEELEKQSLEIAVRAIVWLSANTRPTEELRASLSAELGPIPNSIREKAEKLGVSASLVPAWLGKECPEAVQAPNADLLETRAPLWLRLQTPDPEPVFTEFTQKGWAWRGSQILPNAIEVLGEVDVTESQVFAEGKIEVQDLGSQLVLAAVGISAGERWLDACAGAGGKSLFLADALGKTGQVIAHDIRIGALHALRERALRAGFRNIEVSSRVDGLFDAVLVDAPCTGTGTWRRSPHLKWCTRPQDIVAAAELQLQLLNQFSVAVKSGGRLVYATCSLCRSENEDVVATFLRNHPDFFPVESRNEFDLLPSGGGLRILPAAYDTDGFYVATLRRK